MILLPLLLGFFVFILIVGGAWLLAERGRTTSRRGREVVLTQTDAFICR